jgi:hypothetical protein
VGLVNLDTAVGENDALNGKLASIWAVMARTRGDLAALLRDPRWQPLPAASRARLWTDDFSNVVSIIKFHW